jgi:tetratricopeptide (TPR) repeat protein
MPSAERRRAFDRLRPQLEAYLRYRRGVEAAKHSRFNTRLAEAIKTSGKEEVRGEAINILRQDRDNVLGNGIMGTIAAFDGDYAVSELYLRRAVSSPAASAAAFNNYAEVLRRMGRFEEAEVNARKSVEIAPDFWRTHETLADILLAKDAPVKDVLLHLEKAEDMIGVGREWKTVPPDAATLALIRIAVWARDPSKTQERELLRRKVKRLELSDMQRRRVESLAPPRGRMRR